MIKHLKIFARGVKAMWAVWLFIFFINMAGVIAPQLNEILGLTLLVLPIVGFLVAGVYIIGKDKSK